MRFLQKGFPSWKIQNVNKKHGNNKSWGTIDSMEFKKKKNVLLENCSALLQIVEHLQYKSNLDRYIFQNLNYPRSQTANNLCDSVVEYFLTKCLMFESCLCTFL